MKIVEALTSWGGLATMFIAAVGGGWAVADNLEITPVLKHEFLALQGQINQDEQTLLLLRFQLLMQKKQWGVLSFEDQQELCRIARTLQYVNVPGC